MAEPLPHTKHQIRQQARTARGLLHDRDERSRRVADRLRTLPEYQLAAAVMLYVSVRDEVATTNLIAEALAADKTVIVPYCRNGELQLFHLQDLDELAPGAYGIPEPRRELQRHPDRMTTSTELDLIIVPGVAFDSQGARCGHGKGYYDKLLQTASRKTPLIALAFNCQVFPKIPTESHDVNMDKIITESTIYPDEQSPFAGERRS